MATSKTRKKRRKPCEYAVIDIGSSAIRITIAEVKSGDRWATVDQATRPVALGKDVFTQGTISRETMQQCLQILTSFREMMTGWEVAPENVRIIATSALREAKNRDTFVDQVRIRTGLDITIVEGIEANQLTFAAVREALKHAETRFHRTNSIIMEVGGGSTEMMLMQRGRMVAAHTLHIGTVRLDEQIRSTFGSVKNLSRFLHESIRATQAVLDDELPLKRVKHFVAVGGEARLAAGWIGRKVSDTHWVIEKQRFLDLVAGLQALSVDDIVADYHIPYDEAEPLTPSLLVYKEFLEATSASVLTVPKVSIRDGVLLSITTGSKSDPHEDFYSQTLASTRSLCRKYHVDESHGRHVAQLALQLFDQLVSEHGMDQADRLLLEVAALVHDIGAYVNPSGHHKHGQYIVENSDLFGLKPDDIAIVATVVRYHRKSLPNASHAEYMTLSPQDRVRVLKLASMLRIADGLDRGHRQRITSVTVERTDDEIIIHAEREGDISLARFAVASKGDMFEDVFGLKPVVV